MVENIIESDHVIGKELASLEKAENIAAIGKFRTTSIIILLNGTRITGPSSTDCSYVASEACVITQIHNRPDINQITYELITRYVGGQCH